MQMYEVWFQVDGGFTIDVGRAITLASDQAGAKEMIIGTLDLHPTALLRCDAKRLKPNLFLLERKTVEKPFDIIPPRERPDELAVRKGLQAAANHLAENREYRREIDTYIAQQRWAMAVQGRADPVEFECRIFAVVDATSEEEALRRLGSALLQRSRGMIDESRHVKNVMINLEIDR
jgi:hypothetical protein